MTANVRRVRIAPEIAMVVVALALRLALFAAVGSWRPERLADRVFTGDARDYHRLAVNLAERGIYSDDLAPPYRPETFRVPGYSAYVAIWYRLGGPHPHLAILPQLVLSALTCVVVCRAGTLLFGRSAGLAAGWILAFDYTSIIFGNRLYADTLFTLLVAIGVWAMARFVASSGVSSLAAAGVAFGLATLCRPVSLFVPLALAPVIWLRFRGRPLEALRRWALLAGVFLLTLLPWMARNFGLTGRPYVTTMQASVTSWYLPNAMATEQASRSVGAVLRAETVRFSRGAVRYFAILGSGEVPLLLGIPYRRHDYVALRRAPLGDWVAATLRNRSSPFLRAVVASIVVYLALLYLAAARGLWRALRHRRWIECTLLVATIAYFVLATGPIAREVRYRLPALPAIVILAGLGLALRHAPSAAPESSGARGRGTHHARSDSELTQELRGEQVVGGSP
jgi:4-amino-4-deoxy-L-arabinose transferase-like glycosyltransferase